MSLDQSDQSDVNRLRETLARRRAEFGISEQRNPPERLSPVVALTPPTPEQVARWERAEVERNQREQRAELDRLMRVFYGVVVERYASRGLDSFHVSSPAQRAAVDACREYAATLEARRATGEGIVFYGPSGCGKDHLAMAVCREAIVRHRLECERVNGSEWFGEIRDSMDSERPSTEKRIIERMCEPDFLLVSDPLPPVGALSQHQATMLYRAVESRYFHGKPTIVTINVKDGREAEDRMGMATWDRLKDGAWVIACNWPSYRKPARIINGK